MYCGTIFFLVNYATYLLYFRKNLLEWMYDKTITIDDQIKDENIQYEINREAAKISALYQAKLINMNILQGKKYYLLIKSK